MVSVSGISMYTRNDISYWNFKVYYRNGVRSTFQTFKRVPSQRWGWRVNSFTGLTPKICFISLFLAKSIGVCSEIQKHNNIVLNKLYRIQPNLYIIECGNKKKIQHLFVMHNFDWLRASNLIIMHKPFAYVTIVKLFYRNIILILRTQS